MKKNLTLFFALIFSFSVVAQKSLLKAGVSGTFLGVQQDLSILKGIDLGAEVALSERWAFDIHALFQASGKYETTVNVFNSQSFFIENRLQRARLSQLSMNFLRYPDKMFNDFYYGFGVGLGKQKVHVISVEGSPNLIPKDSKVSFVPISGIVGHKTQIGDKINIEQFGKFALLFKKGTVSVGFEVQIGCMISFIKQDE